jgi:hypothetical protein
MRTARETGHAGWDAADVCSLADLNNIREAGNYPFRDGRITISFAKIAVWKNNPHATFRLMRKNPVQVEPHYVLGEQVGEQAPAGEKTFYSSSNGDSWSLIRDQATGAVAVSHVANPSSSGHATKIDFETVLSGADGPEHQALHICWKRPATQRS